MTSEQTYYGITKAGKRLHFGQDIWYRENHGQEVVSAHCGATIKTYSLDRPLPVRVTEFCRSCFRSEAWQVYEAALLERAREVA